VQGPVDQSALPDFPEPPAGDSAAALEYYKARLEAAKKPAEERKAIRDAERALNQSFVTGTIEVAKGAITRAQEGAKTVQVTAAAVGTAYTAILGVAFSAADNPLPARGAIAPIFLGATVVLAMVYLAFLTRTNETVAVPDPDPDDLTKTTVGLANAFVSWNRTGALERRYWLRASVVMFGFSLVFLAAPFINFTEPAATATSSTAADAQAKPHWPKAPTGMAPRLAAIRYKAEVAEVAAERSGTTAAESVPRSHQDRDWMVVAIVAFVLALLVPWVIGKFADQEADSGGGGSGNDLIAPMRMQ